MPRKKAPEPIPLRRPVTEDDIERAVLANFDALLAGEVGQATETSKLLVRHRRMTVTVLARLLIEDRLPAPGAGFHMIEALTFGYPHDILRQIALNPHAPDVTRFGAHRRMGWQHLGSDAEIARLRQEFLSTMRDPEGMLAVTAAVVLETWPVGLEILDEIVRYLAVLDSAARVAILRRVVDAAEGRAVWLLHAMLAMPDIETQRYAVQELARFRNPVSSGPLSRFVKLTSAAELRDAAEAALQRMRLRAVDRTTDAFLWQLPAHRTVRGSAIGLDGAQTLVLTFEDELTPRLYVEFLVTDAGIADAGGRVIVIQHLEDAGDDEYDDEYDDLEEDGADEQISLAPAASEYVSGGIVRPLRAPGSVNAQIEIDPAHARGIIAAALEQHIASGRPLPPTFELWEPYLHEALPPAPDEPTVPAMLPDRAIAPNPLPEQRALEQMLMGAGFGTWLIPADRLFAAMERVPPPASPRWSNRQYEGLVEQLFTPDDIGTLTRALLRQAWMLDRSGDTLDRDAVLGIVQSLRTLSYHDMPKHPFVRALLQHSAMVALSSSAAALLDEPWDLV